MINVLIIDDDLKICLFFSRLLEQMGHCFKAAHTISQGRQLFEKEAFDLVLLDLELPDGNGLEILPEFIHSFSSPEVIIITGTGNARGAELAFKYGAWDYIQKPFLLEEVSLPITRAIQYRTEKQAAPKLISLDRSKIIGESPALHECLKEVAKAASTDASVLITGETGTGKELFAKAIHENSKRASSSFVAVDCGALPETLVEGTLFGHEKGAFTGAGKRQEGLLVQAHGGTLMLDEVGDLPLAAQKSLLRTLQERRVRPLGGTVEIPVDIRLVSATNLDLDQMVSQKLFREDLLYRIRAMEIKLPALRDRGDDIEEIVLKKLHELSRRYNMETKAVSSEFLQLLKAQKWPGNIRELVNVLEYVLASSGMDPTLFPKHLPPEYRLSSLEFDSVPANTLRMQHPVSHSTEKDDFPTLNAYRTALEKTYLKELIQRAKGNRLKAGELSGLSQSRLYSLLSKHDLSGFSK
ncbi:MAG: sigma-54 dependent transcriptional regulator [Proteobacteria bacterium]|nr:sigma-54 dependent transcriptional regulator [Pseudomonadota bacterium]MBU1388263.1 sigma-54 dependent transcriptional regulator [Pseudomonadota bacterium]MBU1541848.1 sigma-54 dependent transcriptional regulator [Pseudomonadota bacterium]MBU2481517.1 sigma-54 dependent transcriptional regulator [Pseudomonadota bacterium]